MFKIQQSGESGLFEEVAFEEKADNTMEEPRKMPEMETSLAHARNSKKAV